MTLQRATRPLLANAGGAFLVSIVGCGASHANANDNLQVGPEAQTPEAGGEMREGGAETSPKQFIANRPFLFVIRDANGAVLFVGQVVDPHSA